MTDDLDSKIEQLRARCETLGRDKQLLINEVKALSNLVVSLGGGSHLDDLQERLSDADANLVARLEKSLWDVKNREGVYAKAWPSGSHDVYYCLLSQKYWDELEHQFAIGPCGIPYTIYDMVARLHPDDDGDVGYGDEWMGIQFFPAIEDLFSFTKAHNLEIVGGW